MKKSLCYVSALAFTIVSTSVVAQKSQEKKIELDEVVVTATKFETKKKNLGKIVYKLTAKQIEQRQGKTLVQLLNEIPGIEINGAQSNRGQNLGMYIRGGRNKQVAVLIDGINVNDPSSIAGDFDLRQIDLNQIESIEVLKGASSVLYGTGAATGVINILLKKSSKKEFEGNFTTSIGSNRSAEHVKIAPDEFQGNFNFNGTVGKIDYLLSLNANSSSGLSAIESNDINNPFQEDQFYRQNNLLKIGYQVNDKLKLGVQGSFDQFSNEFDATFPLGDASNFSESKQRRAVFSTDYKYGAGTVKLRTFYTEIDRVTPSSASEFSGEVYGFDVFNNYKISQKFSFLIGLTAQYQDMFQKTSYSSIAEGSAKQHFYDPYVSANYNTDFGFNINAGVRMNIHNEYGSHFVYNINPSYNFSVLENRNMKVFASYGTAFITPTLSEIFNRAPGIKELKPENDITIETGFQIDILDNLVLNTTYFYREETDKVVWSSGKYKNNLGTYNVKGLETEITFSPAKFLNLSANYTYTNTDGAVNSLKLPKHKFGARVNYQALETTFVGVNYRFTDKRTDFGNVALSAFSLVDVFVNHKILNDRVTLFTNVTNLFNENYQEIKSYTTRGRNFNLGIRLQF